MRGYGFVRVVNVKLFLFWFALLPNNFTLASLQNGWINIDMTWKFWKKHLPALCSISCINCSFHCFYRNEHHYLVFKSDFCSLTVQAMHVCHTGSSACLLIFASHSLKSHYTHTFPLIKLSIHRYVAKLCNANIPRISMYVNLNTYGNY